MILTLTAYNKENVHIHISEEHFKHLRRPMITEDEIITIAIQCGVDKNILIEYVNDLKNSVQDVHEIDTSCDYSDQL
ncbi:MAG: hypothetical protein NTY39_11150 [Campylobacterales bacterium]|nr:hypothetical protein [Campylobacterales bacterium]